MLSVLAVAIWLRENGRNHLGKWVVLRGDYRLCELVESREDFRLVRDVIRDGDMVLRLPRTWDDRPVVIDFLSAPSTVAAPLPAEQDASNRPSPARTDFEEATRALDQRFPVPEGYKSVTESLITGELERPVRTLPDPLPEELSGEPVRTLPEPLEDDLALNTHGIDEHSAPSRIVTASDEELVAKLAPETFEEEQARLKAEHAALGPRSDELEPEEDDPDATDEGDEPEPATPKKKRAPKKKADT